MADPKDIVRAFLTEVGRKGGLSRSSRKARAARRNLAKGRKLKLAIYRALKPRRRTAAPSSSVSL